MAGEAASQAVDGGDSAMAVAGFLKREPPHPYATYHNVKSTRILTGIFCQECEGCSVSEMGFLLNGDKQATN